MDEGNARRFGATEIAPILAILEEQLGELDRLGAGIAAAHLDAAIQQLRLDQAQDFKDLK
ncbi:hypothetical protein [uncultured Erythrobacter sp.]|uniref:hypothetical protein n=1 Tax=uncultured Erythrobacter sp. TaxID=263913 RepID=UPI00262FCABE|nr:hypothetical protein [uncultured Erythrobacter sp.]